MMFAMSKEKALGDLTPEEFQQKLDFNKRTNERLGLLNASSSTFGNQTAGTGASASSSNNSSSLFGGGGLLGGGFDDIF
ncbi:MAG: hypothetical protein HC908_17910 [Calothrix sp. SM1_7_51]|nr:hypothetical protein [Calothrix sp. SM1_7_51]